MRRAPLLTFTMRQQPIETCAHHDHHVSFLEHQRPRGPCRLSVRVGQETFCHAHRKIRNATGLDELANQVIGLGIGRAFAKDNQGLFCPLDHIKRSGNRMWRRGLRRRGINHFYQRFRPFDLIHHLPQQGTGNIQINPARPARHRRPNCPRQTNTYIFGVQNPVSGLAQGLGNRQLVHFFIVALHQIHHFTLR